MPVIDQILDTMPIVHTVRLYVANLLKHYLWQQDGNNFTDDPQLDVFTKQLQFVEDSDIVVLNLDANDAPSKANKNDIYYMVSSVLNGLKQNTIDKLEQDQFINDLHRCPTIKFDNNPILTPQERNNLQGAGALLFLRATSEAVASRTKTTSEQVANGIAQLNQSLGNQVLEILYKYIGSFTINGDTALGFRVLQRDTNYQDEFHKSGNIFSKIYNLPIRIMTAERDSDLTTSTADFEVHVRLSIDFSLPTENSNRVNYRMQIIKLNPELGLDLSDLEGYRVNRHIVEQVPGKDERDWLIVKAPRLCHRF